MPALHIFRRLLPAFLLYALLGLVLAVAFYGVRFDDPYITYRYAENFAAGRGFAFNPGEPTLITTAPLYALLLGALRRVGLAVPLTSYLIGTGSLVAGATLLHRLLLRAGHAQAGFFAGLCYILFPLMWLTVGFEAPLFIAISLGAFVCVQAHRLTWAGLLCGIALGLRGDGVIVLGMCALLVIVVTQPEWQLPDKRISPLALIVSFLTFLIPALALYAPLAAWLFGQFGSFIPSTLQTKSAQAVSGLTGFYPNTSFPEGALLLMQAYAGQGGLFIIAIVVILLGIAAVIKLARQNSGSAIVLMSAPIIWLLAHFVGYTFIGVAPYVWYYAPMVPGVCVLMGLGLVLLFERLKLTSPNPAQQRAAQVFKLILPVAVIAALLIGDVLAVRIVRGAQPPDPSQVASKVLPETKVEIYQQVGQWLNANTPPEATIGVTELGVMSYYADRPMVDFLGLVQPEHMADIRHGDFVAGLMRQQPDYLALTHINPLYDADPQKEAWFTQIYTPVARFEDARFWGSPMMVWKRTRAPLTATITLNPTSPSQVLSDGWAVTGIRVNTRIVVPNAPMLIQVQLQAGASIGNRTLRVQAEWTDGGDGLPVVSRLIFTDRWRAGEQAWMSLPLVAPANPASGAYIIAAQWLEGGDSARAGFIKVPLTRTIEAPPNAQIVPLSEGVAVAHVGSFSAAPVCNNTAVEVPVLWRGGNPLTVDYTAFVQLRAAGSLSSTVSGDAPPRNTGLSYPTSIWSTSEWIADTHTLELASKPTPGSYDVVVGLYDPVSGARLPVEESPFRTSDGGVKIGEVVIATCAK